MTDPTLDPKLKILPGIVMHEKEALQATPRVHVDVDFVNNSDLVTAFRRTFANFNINANAILNVAPGRLPDALVHGSVVMLGLMLNDARQSLHQVIEDHSKLLAANGVKANPNPVLRYRMADVPCYTPAAREYCGLISTMNVALHLIEQCAIAGVKSSGQVFDKETRDVHSYGVRSVMHDVHDQAWDIGKFIHFRIGMKTRHLPVTDPAMQELQRALLSVPAAHAFALAA